MKIYSDMLKKLVNQHQDELIWIKDSCSRYVYANASCLSFLGMSQIEQLYDKTDYDLPYAYFADQYIQNDQETLMTGSLQVVEPTLNYAGESVLALSYKYSFTHPDTHITGTMGIAKIISCDVIEHSMRSLKHYNLQQLKVSSSLFCFKVNQQARIPLTERELDVFYHVLHGLSQKQVANKLNLSVRTVEDYIDHIKTKLNCGNKHQLFEFAVQHGIINIIPRYLLS